MSAASFALYTTDRLGSVQIADLLTAEAVPQPKALKGTGHKLNGRWAPATVCRILANRTYIGEHSYRKKRVIRKEGEFVGVEDAPADRRIVCEVPALIDAQTFERAQKLLAEGQQMARGNGKRDYLLTGRIVCGACGRSYAGSTTRIYGKVTRMYRCMGTLRRGGCHNPRLYADEIEASVWADIERFVTDPGPLLAEMSESLRKRAQESAPLETEQEDLARNIDAKRAERARVIRLHRQGKITDAEAEAELDDLQRDVDALEGKRSALFARQQEARDRENRLVEVEQLLRSLAQLVRDPVFETRRKIALLLIRRLVVYPSDDPRRGRRRPARTEIVYAFKEPGESDRLAFGNRNAKRCLLATNDLSNCRRVCDDILRRQIEPLVVPFQKRSGLPT